MHAFREAISDLAGIIFSFIELLGSVLALLAVVILVAVILRSAGQAMLGRATLVLPFRGADKAGLCLNEVLAQQLGEIEKAWQELSRRVREAQAADKIGNSAMLVDLGRSKPDTFLGQKQELLILSDPTEGQAIGPIGFGAFSFSPDSLFALSYKIRTLLARKTIRGGVDQLGATVRFSTTLSTRRKHSFTIVLTRQIEQPDQNFDLIDDMAFSIIKIRWGLESEARTWQGYWFFMEGYAHHIRYTRSGSIAEREAAIDSYQRSLTVEPDYELAHYNLGSLLYNRFTAADNNRAIENLRKASRTRNDLLKALTLGLLARAYCQQVHRYGHEVSPWIPWADEASAKAVQLAPDLEEVWLARGFSYQFSEKAAAAIEAFKHVITLPGDSTEELRIKSTAENNRGYITMTVLGNLNEAEELFRHALELDPYNKFACANLGEISKRRKDYPAALAAFQKALELDPAYINGANELGMLYLDMAAGARNAGHREDAETYLSTAHQWHYRALELIPEDEQRHRAEIQKRFARAYGESGLENEAAPTERPVLQTS